MQMAESDAPFGRDVTVSLLTSSLQYVSSATPGASSAISPFNRSPTGTRPATSEDESVNDKTLPYYASDVAQEIVEGWLRHLPAECPFALEGAEEIATALNKFYGVQLNSWLIRELVSGHLLLDDFVDALESMRTWPAMMGETPTDWPRAYRAHRPPNQPEP